MNFRPRFRLMTLLLFVLLIGSGASLWWNWDPWLPSRTILISNATAHRPFFELTRDGKYLFVSPGSSPDMVPGRTDIFIKYDVASGKPVYTLRGGNGTGYWRVSPAGKYVLLFNHALAVRNYPVTGFWNGETGEPLDARKFFDGNLDIAPYFSHDDNYVLLNLDFDKSNRRLLKMPEFAPVENINEQLDTEWRKSSIGLSRNAEILERWSDGGSVEQVYAIPSGRTISANSPSETSDGITYSANGSKLALWNNQDFKQRVYDTATGRLIAEFTLVQEWSRFLRSDSSLFATVKRSLPMGGEEIFVWDLAHAEKPLWKMPFNKGRFIAAGDSLVENDGQHITLLETRTGVPIWTAVAEEMNVVSADRLVILSHADDIERIARVVSLRTGKTLVDFDSFRWSRQLPAIRECDHDKDATFFVTLSASKGEQAANDTIVIWRQHRPEEWYGIAWLPEFWLTLFFTVSLVVTVVRRRQDRIDKNRPAAPPNL